FVFTPDGVVVRDFRSCTPGISGPDVTSGVRETDQTFGNPGPLQLAGRHEPRAPPKLRGSDQLAAVPTTVYDELKISGGLQKINGLRCFGGSEFCLAAELVGGSA